MSLLVPSKAFSGIHRFIENKINNNSMFSVKFEFSFCFAVFIQAIMPFKSSLYSYYISSFAVPFAGIEDKLICKENLSVIRTRFSRPMRPFVCKSAITSITYLGSDIDMNVIIFFILIVGRK